MNCPKCNGTVADGAAYCPACGTRVTVPGPGKLINEVTREWLKELLTRGEYEASFSDQSADRVIAKHATRPNVTLTIQKKLNLITVLHNWRMHKPGWGKNTDLLKALNLANSTTWRDTFFLDKDGDLGVSSYITLVNGLTDADILGHLERESAGFYEVIGKSGLKQFIK